MTIRPITASNIEISLSLHAEISTDLDTGREWLVADMDGGMPQETTSTVLRGMAAQVRQRLEEIEQLATWYEAITRGATA